MCQTKKAEILVKCIPSVSSSILNKIKSAVLEDYKTFYTSTPVERLEKRLKNKDIEAGAVARYEEIIGF